MNNRWIVFCFSLLYDTLNERLVYAIWKITFSHTNPFVRSVKLYFALSHRLVYVARRILIIYKAYLRILNVNNWVSICKFAVWGLYLKYLIHYASQWLPLPILHNNCVPDALVVPCKLRLNCRCLISVKRLQKLNIGLAKFFISTFTVSFANYLSVLNFYLLPIVNHVVHYFI